MNKFISYSILAATAASGMAFGQTAYTTPVGYVSVGSSTGNAVSPSTDVILSVPLDRPTVYSGLVSTVTGGNKITLQGTPGFTTGQFTTTPNIVKVASGTGAGFYALISANDTTSITVTLPAGQSLSSVVSGDKIAVSRAWTATAFFAGATLNDSVELYQYSGVAPGINPSADFAYAFDGANWIDEGSGNTVDPVIYPGESFVLRNGSPTAAITSIVVSGQVPVSSFANVVANFQASHQQDLPFALFTPINQTLAQTGLLAIAADGDELYFYNNSATGINKSAATSLVYDAGSSSFLDQGSGNPVDPNTFIFKAGEGFTLRRAASSATTLHKFTPSYAGSL